MKFGVVGYGSIGSRHAGNLRVLGHEVLVYDPASPRDVRFEREIYEKCDAIVIATPSTFHAQGVRACAERGKHMLIEKPIALVDHGLRELLDLAAKNKAVVMMGNNLRFHPCVQQAKDWLDTDEIGDPIWAHFTCAQHSAKPLYLSDGVILNTGSHEVDMALHLLGPAKAVYAQTRFHCGGDDTAIEDIADFMLLHDNGCRSSFHLDFVTPNPIREAWIVGDKDRIGMELINRAISLGAHHAGRAGNFDGDYFAEMEAFIARIEGKDVPGATGEDGLTTLKLLLDLRKKAGLT
jgi:UDP-N-acetylglucosamine 3-dehydrogenase